MSIADDLRAAAKSLHEPEFKFIKALLRAHASTIERVEKEMREYVFLSMPGTVKAVDGWADVLKGETT